MDDIKLSFGKKIKFLRENKGYSQEKLGHLAGLHRTYISDIERGLKNVSLENIEKLAKALDVDIYFLFK